MKTCTAYAPTRVSAPVTMVAPWAGITAGSYHNRGESKPASPASTINAIRMGGL